jgi:hypothetical protein
MEVKIVSDGTVIGTKIFDATTGAELKNVTSITWDLNVDKWEATVDMTLINVPVELRGKADVTIEEWPLKELMPSDTR